MAAWRAGGGAGNRIVSPGRALEVVMNVMRSLPPHFLREVL
jgi:hypothetical protein